MGAWKGQQARQCRLHCVGSGNYLKLFEQRGMTTKAIVKEETSDSGV